MQKIVLSLVLLFLSSAALAQGNWFASMGGGAMFPDISGSHSISSGAGWPNDNLRDSDIDAAGLFVFDAGYQWARNQVWFPFYSLALNYIYAAPARVDGTVEQYSLPEFTNYDYQYKIQTQTIMAQFKADIYQWHHFMPFLMAGAGVALNYAGQYTEQPLSGVTPRVSPGFSGHTNNCFAYAFGAGLDYVLGKNVWATLMYQYNHLGQAQTGPGVNDPTLTDTNYSTDTLKTNVRSNAVILTVTYLFDQIA